MRSIYQISIYLYGCLIFIASIWNTKAKKWIWGRHKWRDQFSDLPTDRQWVWLHCASLGEFEQGRPILEHIHSLYPEYAILLTFFSPSGFEVRKHYSQADKVTYLPLDTRRNARDFIQQFHLKLVIFVKYDLWLHFLQELFSRHIPVILISARMNENSSFFKSIFSSLYRNTFQQLDAIFTQDILTAQLIQSFASGANVIQSSDTRYDRVLDTVTHFKDIPEISIFANDDIVLIAGSTWPQDEEILFEAYKKLQHRYPIKMIVAPHEINKTRIMHWISKFPEESLTFSNMDQLAHNHRILWIDNVGMLSRIYAYGQMAYVGGAWKQGLHNILEPAVFGIPIAFGPKYHKFPEAQALININCGFPVSSIEDLVEFEEKIILNPELRKEIHRKLEEYVHQQSGATSQILGYCKEHVFLPSA